MNDAHYVRETRTAAYSSNHESHTALHSTALHVVVGDGAILLPCYQQLM